MEYAELKRMLKETRQPLPKNEGLEKWIKKTYLEESLIWAVQNWTENEYETGLEEVYENFIYDLDFDDATTEWLLDNVNDLWLQDVWNLVAENLDIIDRAIQELVKKL